VVRRCSGIVPDIEFLTIPGLRRIISLRFMLRRARETSSYGSRKGGKTNSIPHFVSWEAD
jgi:hypothetical protein